MPSAKLAVAGGLAALSLSACGTVAKPEAGTLKAIVKSHKSIDDPRKRHIQCLQQEHIPVRRVGATAIQVGTPPSGPSVQFTPTPGSAQEAQIVGDAQAAEVIGSALLYPHQAGDKLLKQVEDCVAKGVSG